jgi:hypothetical protein
MMMMMMMMVLVVVGGIAYQHVSRLDIQMDCAFSMQHLQYLHNLMTE